MLSTSHQISKSILPLTLLLFFFFNDPPPPQIYPLPLHDALPISRHAQRPQLRRHREQRRRLERDRRGRRSHPRAAARRQLQHHRQRFRSCRQSGDASHGNHQGRRDRADDRDRQPSFWWRQYHQRGRGRRRHRHHRHHHRRRERDRKSVV